MGDGDGGSGEGPRGAQQWERRPWGTLIVVMASQVYARAGLDSIVWLILCQLFHNKVV